MSPGAASAWYETGTVRDDPTLHDLTHKTNPPTYINPQRTTRHLDHQMIDQVETFKPAKDNEMLHETFRTSRRRNGMEVRSLSTCR